MAAAQDHISGATPLGATLVDGGATFRVWAPGARSVHVALGGAAGYAPTPDDALVKNPDYRWTGFFPGVVDGTKYRFWVVGEGGAGFKRDPWARELEFGDFGETDCVVRERDSFPWHDERFVPPAFNDLIVYSSTSASSPPSTTPAATAGRVGWRSSWTPWGAWSTSPTSG